MNSALWSFGSLGYGALRGLRNLTFACLIATPALAEPVTVAALGDSLTAGFGLPDGDGFVPKLQAWLRSKGRDVIVLNAGVSGDTTAGGLQRLDWTLSPDVDALIVELGANDMLRGLSPGEARSNLEEIVKRTSERGLPVLLVGIEAPNNYGPDYKTEFDAIYADLAAKYDTVLDPNFFGGLMVEGADPSTVARYFQEDGEHPNQRGVELIVNALGPKVLELLKRVPK